jgi:predicted dehydrogenase
MTTIAVLGLGSIGLRHARNLLALGQSVIGFDPDRGRRQELENGGGKTATTRDEAIAAADAVVVASPSGLHLNDMAAAIDGGRHVFVEKPLAHTFDGVQAVLDSAEAKGLTVFAGLNLRYHPGVERIRALMSEGAIGQMLWARFVVSSYLPDWRPSQDHRKGYAAEATSGGIIFDSIHELDLANYLLGPAKVLAAAARNTGELQINAEDTADILLQHEAGWQSSIHMDFVSRRRQRVTAITGTLGAVELDMPGRRLQRYDEAGQAMPEEIFGGEINDDYSAEMKHFIACVEGSETPRCNGREALVILRQAIDARSRQTQPLFNPG